MKLDDYIDKVQSIDLINLKNKTFNDLIAKFHAKNLMRLYILKENKPVFVISPKEIVEIFLKNLHTQNVYNYLKDRNYLRCLNSDIHIIDAYYQMRKNKLSFIPVCKDNKLIGEIDFNTLSLKIAYIAIKDELTGVYNKKYFDVIIEEYRDFKKPIGIIFLEIRDLPVFEGLYGVDMEFDILKNYAKILKNSIRDIDFIFRWDNQFRIMIFNSLEITVKIFERIKIKLENLIINELKIPFNICMTHIPEIHNDILLGIEECEEKLIKRD